MISLNQATSIDMRYGCMNEWPTDCVPSGNVGQWCRRLSFAVGNDVHRGMPVNSHHIIQCLKLYASLFTRAKVSKLPIVDSPYIEGILPKGPYPPCLRMADRALLASLDIAGEGVWGCFVSLKSDMFYVIHCIAVFYIALWCCVWVYCSRNSKHYSLWENSTHEAFVIKPVRHSWRRYLWIIQRLHNHTLDTRFVFVMYMSQNYLQLSYLEYGFRKCKTLYYLTFQTQIGA